MQIGRLIILPWNKKNFIPRLILIGLALGWVAFLTWGAWLFKQESQIEQQRVVQQQSRQEQIRRQAAYQQRFLQQQQQRRSRNNVQNAIDGVKK